MLSRLEDYLEKVDANQKFVYSKETVKRGIKDAMNFHCGATADEIEIHPDIYSKGTYAVRIKKDKMTFLITNVHKAKTISEIAGNIEEVDFGTWPPKEN